MMPAVTHNLTVNAPIMVVWDFAKEPRNWAAQMPGFQTFETTGSHDSAWTVKPDIALLNRSIILDVHVTKWREPVDIAFTFKGRSDPIKGSAACHGEAQGDQTAITLDFVVEGSGPLGRLISARAEPMLKRFGQEFATNLERALETYAASHA